MNFLAHIYLSGDDEDITIGNFIADGIKGKQYQKYPLQIQKGILLHRAIDTFTDKHPTFKLSTARLHENYSHYSGVIVDILYDHFLARNWKDYHDQTLEVYVDDFYDLLEKKYHLLPMRIRRMMPYMISDNWLVNYATIPGISKILSQMNRRTQGKSRMDLAVRELELHYEDFEGEFRSYFNELINFCEHKLSKL